mmetsp:Transcript_47896/g.147536  ORF Transcript_47896/g.147536 Transcript_47896/m.147536 type:complete len:214 (+) Transcript_47896:223-864(+)
MTEPAPPQQPLLSQPLRHGQLIRPAAVRRRNLYVRRPTARRPPRVEFFGAKDVCGEQVAEDAVVDEGDRHEEGGEEVEQRPVPFDVIDVLDGPNDCEGGPDAVSGEGRARADEGQEQGDTALAASGDNAADQPDAGDADLADAGPPGLGVVKHVVGLLKDDVDHTDDEHDGVPRDGKGGGGRDVWLGDAHARHAADCPLAEAFLTHLRVVLCS